MNINLCSAWDLVNYHIFIIIKASATFVNKYFLPLTASNYSIAVSNLNLKKIKDHSTFILCVTKCLKKPKPTPSPPQKKNIQSYALIFCLLC